MTDKDTELILGCFVRILWVALYLCIATACANYLTDYILDVNLSLGYDFILGVVGGHVIVSVTAIILILKHAGVL